MPSPSHDRDILRQLASQYAEQAALPINNERAELWRKLNDLEPVRPMIWLDEIPWSELNVNDELTLQCEDPFHRGTEWYLRMILYYWRHFPGDMILQPFLGCPKVFHSTGFGVDANIEFREQTETENIRAMHFTPVIVEPKDVEKIQTPRVTYDAATTEANFQRTCDLFDGVIPVRKIGQALFWTCPADNVFMWFGLQQAMMDLVMRPDMVHEAMRRTAAAYHAELDQMESLGLLECNNGPYRVGSGGYGYTKQLPSSANIQQPVRAIDSWGCAAAQIFSEISPDMHEEFVLQYTRPWMARWGMTYYGCCEPLHRKIDILRSIPNLRKISMSPWVNHAQAAEQIGRQYVYSLKPNPAILAEDRWRPDQARKELRDALEATRGCNVEIILKDISTVRNKPQRLWEWVEMATEEARRFEP